LPQTKSPKKAQIQARAKYKIVIRLVGQQNVSCRDPRCQLAKLNLLQRDRCGNYHINSAANCFFKKSLPQPQAVRGTSYLHSEEKDLRTYRNWVC